MRKFIDAVKLIAEINEIIATVKVKNHPDEFGSIEQCLAAAEIEALNLTLDYIKELQQEQPDNEDIDKVAQELYEHLYELKRRNNVPTNLYDKQEIIDLWKAGVEYGRNHPKQEQPEVDFENELKNEKTKLFDACGPLTGEQQRLAIRNFARHFWNKGYNAKKEE